MDIKKIKITNGVYWIEVQELDLRILCASPSDSVKHLMKQGLIHEIESDSITYETGPNAILLSDIMVQNSLFSNLAEFPVLQMLYKQGMIIPNHPGNKGIKPIIIGSKEQVDIQLEYIYRGNYGLISQDELIEAGASQKLAKEIMDMKLKFAFGKMQDSNNLLDKVYVTDNQPTQIKGELYIKRVSVNIFEFTYKNKSVLVDLNLYLDESYGTTYHLGLTNFKREYFSIIHTGEGDGWDIKRPCMDSIITFQGKIFLIDAGPNINTTLNSLGISANEIEGIFHTHAHDDHFAGITSLIQSDHKLKYYTSSIVRASVFKKLATLLSINEQKLHNFFDVIDLELNQWNNIDGLEVKPILSPHPVETNIMYFRTLSKHGYKSYAHLADICSFSVLDSMEKKNDQDIGMSGTFIEKTKFNYLTPVDVKKIDNGGGMIHGMGEDFVDDNSAKLMLSHSSIPLTKELRQIGSGAPFGSIDTLIPAQEDYSYGYAFRYLQSYFPKVPLHWIKVILNNAMELFNPETIIIKENNINDFVYLIITGNVEMLQYKEGILNTLSSGAIMGDFSGIHALPSLHTYRALSYVKVLSVPVTLYTHFIKDNNLYSDIENLYDNRSFLESTWIFGESISYAQLNNITHNLITKNFKKGERLLSSDISRLKLLKSGKAIKTYINHHSIELEIGDFFNESEVLFGTKNDFEIIFEEDSEIVGIDIQYTKEIPIVYWKLYMIYEKRMKDIQNKDEIFRLLL